MTTRYTENSRARANALRFGFEQNEDTTWLSGGEEEAQTWLVEEKTQGQVRTLPPLLGL